NVNSRMTYLQIFGSALAIKSGVSGTHSRAVQIRVNNENRASGGSDMYGSYAANEAYNSEWADRQFPNNTGANLYSVVRDVDPSEFEYRGEGANSYRNTYFKDTNVSEDDWQDLIGMLAVMGTNGPAGFTP